MEIIVQNPAIQTIGVIDSVESLIWTERYFQSGDFEIYTPISNSQLMLLQENNYLRIPISDRVMVIESLELKTDIELGNKLVVKGRSWEQVLDRRIILQQTVIDGSLQTAIQQLLNENVISSSQPLRNIPGLIFETSEDLAITELTLQAQYDAENLYDTIQYLCETYKIGFKTTLNANDQFVFALYAGKDRSYTQTDTPYVVFSPNFDNLINSNYYQTSKNLKTYTLIFGDAYYGGARPRVEAVPEPKANYLTLSGLNRRELFTDAPDLSKYEGEEEIPIPDYNEQAKERGRAHLKEYVPFNTFAGQADTTIGFQYGIDFFLGDIVQTENEYGLQGRTRVTEVTISESLNGIRIFPTFAIE